MDIGVQPRRKTAAALPIPPRSPDVSGHHAPGEDLSYRAEGQLNRHRRQPDHANRLHHFLWQAAIGRRVRRQYLMLAVIRSVAG
jgi:hypothetical protein